MMFDKKIFSNSAWMMADKFIGIFGLIFVTSYVAKYIGPENFGKITFATTIFAFIQTLTWFGNQEIVFKRVSKNHVSGLKYLLSTQKIRKILFLILSLPVLVGLYIYTDHLTFVFGVATALATYFVTQDMYSIFNNAILNSYINATVNMIGLVIALILRYFIVYLKLDVSFLALPIILVSLVPYLLKKLIFNRNDTSKVISIKKYSKYYFFAGSSLVVSTLAISFYTQITSFLLATLRSTAELGLYAAAIPLGMSWSFVNFAIITSVLSIIYREKDNYNSYKMVAQLNLIIIFVSLIVIIILALIGQWLIQFLYGNQYSASYGLLIIFAFSTMFSGLGTVAARLMVKEESYNYISKKMLFVAIFSLPIAFFMIYFFGLKGAAYSVLLIEFLSATLFNYFYKQGLIFKIHFFPFYKHSLKIK